MTDRDYIKFNTSVNTCSEVTRNSQNERYAKVDLRLPANIANPNRPIKEVKIQLSKMRLTLHNCPIATIPLDQVDIERKRVLSKGRIVLYPFNLYRTSPSGDGLTVRRSCRLDEAYTSSAIVPMRIPESMYYVHDKQSWERDMRESGVIEFPTVESVCDFLSSNLDSAKESLFEFAGYDTKILIEDGKFSMKFPASAFARETDSSGFRFPANYGLFFSGGGAISNREEYSYPLFAHQEDGHYTAEAPVGCYSIVVNSYVRDLFSFLPWIEFDNNTVSHTTNPQTDHKIPGWEDANFGSSLFYLLDTTKANLKIEKEETERLSQLRDAGVPVTDDVLVQSSVLNYSYDNVATLRISSLHSIVILVGGVNIQSQTQPINIRQATGSSLTTSIPVLEQYYPLTQNISDLHDDLIINVPTFDDTAVPSCGKDIFQQRLISFQAAYLLSDGTMKYLTLPDSGIFSLQVTFGIFY